MARQSQEIQPDPPYGDQLKGVLSFRRFINAELTLKRLEDLRQQFLAAGDDKGIEYCRQVALLGRRRAEGLSRSGRVSAARRRHKAEIADWFRIWLESPDLFESWLLMRKNTPEFRELEELDKSM
jgi:hypothetical protein